MNANVMGQAQDEAELQEEYQNRVSILHTSKPKRISQSHEGSAGHFWATHSQEIKLMLINGLHHYFFVFFRLPNLRSRRRSFDENPSTSSGRWVQISIEQGEDIQNQATMWIFNSGLFYSDVYNLFRSSPTSYESPISRKFLVAVHTGCWGIMLCTAAFSLQPLAMSFCSHSLEDDVIKRIVLEGATLTSWLTINRCLCFCCVKHSLKSSYKAPHFSSPLCRPYASMHSIIRSSIGPHLS